MLMKVCFYPSRNFSVAQNHKNAVCNVRFCHKNSMHTSSLLNVLHNIRTFPMFFFVFTRKFCPHVCKKSFKKSAEVETFTGVTNCCHSMPTWLIRRSNSVSSYLLIQIVLTSFA